ncbi:hypothetical protein LY16_01931 [Xenorhabdus doucetiae]|uniref:Uncharacterized protein n=1 Tax=Xenorhabdus doucetiae TaxID=351671 RepID=A0ABY3NRK7_9GAMM|nr:hypothetical protein LY16_01931 [Xenorhabdus doucetiae]
MNGNYTEVVNRGTIVVRDDILMLRILDRTTPKYLRINLIFRVLFWDSALMDQIRNDSQRRLSMFLL